MRLKTTLFSIFTLFIFTTVSAQNTTLIINELSQGSGTQEYVEFLVVSTSTNTCVRPTLDLRKWIFDDNNGYFKSGSGSGIAKGAMRFADNAFWSAVPAGTLILIYNADNFSSSIIPAVDTDLNDGNCRLIIPSNSNLLEKHSDLPDNSTSTYSPSGWITGGDWATVAMRNDGDAFQIYAPNNLTTPVHAVSYGDNTQHQDIYFSSAATGLVYSFKNSISNDYHLQGNWDSKPIAGNQTPGLPNSTQNEAFILSQSHNCSLSQNNGNIDLQLDIVQPTTCNEDNGVLGSSVNGGTTPYTYTWSNGDGSSQISNVASGNYTLIVEDANGCKDTSSINLPASVAGPDLTLTPQATTCAKDNGAVTSSVVGGTSPYTYAWSNGSIASQISNVASGNYTLVVEDVNGCKDTAMATVATSTNDIVINLISQSASCGQNNGSVTSEVSGGTEPYTYSWSNGASSSNLTNVSQGNYNLTVTDDKGCEKMANIVVNNSSSLTISNINVTDASCGANNGGVSLSVQGGNSPYTYVWSNGATSQNIQNLSAGQYNVTVSDQSGCSVSETITVNESGSLNVSVDASKSTIENGDSTNLVVSVSGGSTPYQYSWTTEESINCTNCQTVTATPMETTTYIVNVTSGEGCKGSASITISIETNCGIVFFPNIFTPNNDGANDTFFAQGKCMKSGRLYIYNRWGEIVFETSNINESWDGTFKGKEVATGVYFYKADIDTKNDGIEHFSGSITLTR